MAGPTEKSNMYANSRPPSEAIIEVIQTIESCHLAEKAAEIVAGIIRYAKTTITPPT